MNDKIEKLLHHMLQFIFCFQAKKYICMTPFLLFAGLTVKLKAKYEFII